MVYLPLTSVYKSMRTFYDDLVTFCKQNSLSVVEVLTVTTVMLGFCIFDLFASVSEEDVVDTISNALFVFVLVLFAALLLAVDIQYIYMVSSVSGGDFTIRVILSDLVNNFLCALRIFFC